MCRKCIRGNILNTFISVVVSPNIQSLCFYFPQCRHETYIQAASCEGAAAQESECCFLSEEGRGVKAAGGGPQA